MSNATRSHTNPSHITFLHDQAKTDFQNAVSAGMTASSVQSAGADATLATVQQVGNYSWNGTNWERQQVDASGNLKVNVVSSSAGGDATAANQVIGNASLASIDGKITAVDTGAVVVSSSALPSGASTSVLQTTANGHLASMDGKITACNTGAVAVTSSALPSGASTSANQAIANASLSSIDTDTTSIDSKIVICDTGSVSVSSSALPSGAATSLLQGTANGHLATIAGDTTSLDAKIISGTDHTITGSGRQQVACYGLDNNSDLHMLHLNNTGDLNVEISEFARGQTTSALSFPVVLASDDTVSVKETACENKGSRNNLSNNVSIVAGANSTAVNVADMRNANIIYEDTSTSSFDGLAVDISVDFGSNWHENFSSLYPFNNTAGTKRVATYSGLNLAGITNIRLRNTSSTDTYTNVQASVVGCP